MNLSLTEQLILGILVEQPRHGYDIEKLIIERGMRKWMPIGFSSIYYALDKLEAKGLIVSASHHGKEKKQYSVTDEGVDELKGQAKKLVKERQPANTHFVTGLATSGLIDASEFTELLRQRKASISFDLRALQTKRLAIKAMPEAARRLFSLSEVLLDAELNWINKEIEKG